LGGNLQENLSLGLGSPVRDRFLGPKWQIG